jgi:hypothetical protein
MHFFFVNKGTIIFPSSRSLSARSNLFPGEVKETELIDFIETSFERKTSEYVHEVVLKDARWTASLRRFFVAKLIDFLPVLGFDFNRTRLGALLRVDKLVYGKKSLLSYWNRGGQKRVIFRIRLERVGAQKLLRELVLLSNNYGRN